MPAREFITNHSALLRTTTTNCYRGKTVPCKQATPSGRTPFSVLCTKSVYSPPMGEVVVTVRLTCIQNNGKLNPDIQYAACSGTAVLLPGERQGKRCASTFGLARYFFCFCVLVCSADSPTGLQLPIRPPPPIGVSHGGRGHGRPPQPSTRRLPLYCPARALQHDEHYAWRRRSHPIRYSHNFSAGAVLRRSSPRADLPSGGQPHAGRHLCAANSLRYRRLRRV